jgi:hypothetical protein
VESVALLGDTPGFLVVSITRCAASVMLGFAKIRGRSPMPQLESVMPFIEAAFDAESNVRPGNPRHFLVTRRMPLPERPNRFAREIVVVIERSVESEILAASDDRMGQVLGPHIQRAIPTKLAGYSPAEQNHEPFLVIIGMESIGL